MSPHDRLLVLARAYLPTPSPTADACLACLAAARPGDVPGGPGVGELALKFVIAFVRRDPVGLPPGLASHLADWLNFPVDPTPFLSAWASSDSVAEVANRLRTDPDEVLYLADGLRKRGVELAATPGAV